jgi:hypothetical protein
LTVPNNAELPEKKTKMRTNLRTQPRSIRLTIRLLASACAPNAHFAQSAKFQATESTGLRNFQRNLFENRETPG